MIYTVYIHIYFTGLTIFYNECELFYLFQSNCILMIYRIKSSSVNNGLLTKKTDLWHIVL